jgi:hypothetical protein
MIHYRTLKPGEEQAAYDIIAQSYAFTAFEYFTWRFMDNPSWKYEYTTVGEIDGQIVAVFFMEPQVMTFLDGFLTVMVGGGGAVREQYRRKGYYKMMNTLNIEKTRALGKDVYVAYAIKKDVAYGSLERSGFFPLGVQSHFVKILHIKETVESVMGLLNQRKVPENLVVRIRISPLSEDPFIVQVRNGTFSIQEDSSDFDMNLSGDVHEVMNAMIMKNPLKISSLLLRRKTRVRIRFSSLGNLACLIRSIIMK